MVMYQRYLDNIHITSIKNKAIMAQNYGIKIDLLKLQGACMKNLTGRSGQSKRCVIIPVDDNDCMFLGEKGCYLNVSAFETQNNQYGDTHMLKPDIPKEIREQMTDEQKNAVPILGNMRPMGPQQMQVNGHVDIDAPEGQRNEDLPF